MADPPVREVIEVNDDFTSEECGFPVRVQTTGTIVRTTFTGRDGEIDRIHEVYPTYRMVLTNVETAETLKVAIPGPFFVDFHPDGSSTQVGTGPWFFVGNPDNDEPGLYLLKGRFVVEVDPQGEVTSFTRHGRLVDLCAKLAS